MTFSFRRSHFNIIVVDLHRLKMQQLLNTAHAILEGGKQTRTHGTMEHCSVLLTACTRIKVCELKIKKVADSN